MKNILIYHINKPYVDNAILWFMNHIAPFVDTIICICKKGTAIDTPKIKNVQIINSDIENSLDAYEFVLKDKKRIFKDKINKIIFCNTKLFGPISSPKKFFDFFIKDNADVVYLENNMYGIVSPYCFAIKSQFKTISLIDIVYKKTNLSYKSYLTSDKSYNNKTDAWLVQTANNIIIQKSPFFSRDIFRIDPSEWLACSLGKECRNILNYINGKNKKITDLLLDSLLKDTKMSVLKNNLHLNYILPTHNFEPCDFASNKKIALVCYIYYKELIDYCYKYALSMPNNSDIFIVTCNNEVYDSCLKRFTSFPCNSVNVRMMKNRGRDVAAYLVAARDVFYKYDYICCIHDKKSPQYKPAISKDFNFHLFECNLASKDYVINVLKTFEKNKKIGMLIPVLPNFGGGLVTIGNSMHLEGNKVKNLLKFLHCNVPYDEDVCAPLGTMFWCRGKAFLPMFHHDWTHTDFPEEPNASSGTLLHAIERFYPFAIQEAGFLVGSICPLNYAELYLDNLYWTAKRYIQIQKKLKVQKDLHFRDLKRYALEYFKRRIKKIFKQKTKNKTCGTGYIRYVDSDNNNIKIYLLSACKDVFLKIGKKAYNPKENTSDDFYGVNEVALSCGMILYLFEIPIKNIKNKKFKFESNSGNIKIIINGIYSLMQLTQKGVFIYATNKYAYVYSKFKLVLHVLFGIDHSFMDKLLFIFILFTRVFCKNIMFCENGGAADNAFETFKYAIRKKSKKSFFICDEENYSSLKKEYKKNVVCLKSLKCMKKILFCKSFVTSFTLNEDVLKKNSFFKDIHYLFMGFKWFFIPHGISYDKDSYEVHKILWNQPTKSYVSSKNEKYFLEQKMGYENVSVYGYPRMDKWYNVYIEPNNLIIFFTWRRMWNNSNLINKENFKNSDYCKTIVELITEIKKHLKNINIYYVFHHEVVKHGFDTLIKESLKNNIENYIYLKGKENIDTFNEIFANSAFLITDYSSVAYDFEYKKGSVAIYYMPKNFIDGHYKLNKNFNRHHPGILINDIKKLIVFLNKKPCDLHIKKTFFKYHDGSNSERVYNDILYTIKNKQ